MVDGIKPGENCWYRLMTPDTMKARQFYESLMGWESYDIDVGHDRVYSVFTEDGKDKFGMISIPKAQQDKVRPHWYNFLKVSNLDEMVKKALALGAEIHLADINYEKIGRFVMLKDPTGALFGFWQAAE